MFAFSNQFFNEFYLFGNLQKYLRISYGDKSMLRKVIILCKVSLNIFTCKTTKFPIQIQHGVYTTLFD